MIEKTAQTKGINHKSGLLAIIGLIIAMIFWASSFIAMKSAFRFYDSFFVIFGRMAVASAGFLLFIRQIKKVRIRKRDLKFLLLMGLCEPCLYFVLEAFSLKYTSASQSAMITSMLPLMVAFAAWLFLGEKISFRSVIGFIIAIAGVSWLSVAGEATAEAPNPFLGNLLEFMAMICATGYTVSLKYLSDRYSPVFLTSFQSFIGAIFFGVFLFFRPESIPTEIHPGATLTILYLGIAVSMAAYGLYNYGVSIIPANQASAFTNLIPVLGMIMGWVILGERFTKWQYLASALVFAGVFISQNRSDQKKTSSSPVRGIK
ncbi:DMT family transporter [Desulforegula conservatrix]|uniref:DMT family transporter n=1 Tax=Desulforegula conservatrix TaxID=153026 RepID=UPI000408DE38|nr:DMT family transporter [Desulforegula conservatrix]